MNFIETLKSLGGVKPCLVCKGMGEDLCYESRGGSPCPDCRGTGNIIDLVPLLANPKELSDVVDNLLCIDFCESIVHVKNEELFIIGPQRASNLVYEVARQLGGTAVVAQHEPVVDDILADMKRRGLVYGVELERRVRAITGYRLSFPIPPDATVLFVTDRFDEAEMSSVRNLVPNPIRWLPHILALVSSVDEIDGPRGGGAKVISLHKE